MFITYLQTDNIISLHNAKRCVTADDAIGFVRSLIGDNVSSMKCVIKATHPLTKVTEDYIVAALSGIADVNIKGYQS